MHVSLIPTTPTLLASRNEKEDDEMPIMAISWLFGLSEVMLGFLAIGVSPAPSWWLTISSPARPTGLLISDNTRFGCGLGPARLGEYYVYLL